MAFAGVDQCGDLLEIGCGLGFTARYLTGRYESYVGLDHSRAAIELARQHNAGQAVQFEAMDAGAFETDRLFDTVVMIGALHHMPDPTGSLRNVLRLAKPGACVIANEPQNANHLISLARRVRAAWSEDYSSDQDEYSEAQFRGILTSAGLTNVRIVPQGFFSTPFAEVVMPLQGVTAPLSALACAGDRFVEATMPALLKYLSWNLIGVGTADAAARALPTDRLAADVAL